MVVSQPTCILSSPSLCSVRFHNQKSSSNYCLSYTSFPSGKHDAFQFCFQRYFQLEHLRSCSYFLQSELLVSILLFWLDSVEWTVWFYLIPAYVWCLDPRGLRSFFKGSCTSSKTGSGSSAFLCLNTCFALSSRWVRSTIVFQRSFIYLPHHRSFVSF